MSDLLAQTASEADSIWAARGASVANAIRARVDDLREVIDGKGADLLAALGARSEDVSARIVGAGNSIKARVDDLRAVIDGKGADLLAALGRGRGSERARHRTRAWPRWRTRPAATPAASISDFKRASRP